MRNCVGRLFYEGRRSTGTSGVDKHLAYAPASQLGGIVLMLYSTDATQEGGRHGTIRSD
jgi:hypothetical protein